MGGVSHDLEIIDFPERDVDGQLIEKRRRGVGGIGLRVERMHVADQRTLLMRQIRDRGVRRRETRRGGIGIAGVFRQQIM